MTVAIVHDYLTQRGGAERVVLAMLRAFPDAVVHTSLYDPDTTFPEFRNVEIRTSMLNRIPVYRRSHRLALPLLAPSFSALRVEADVAICSSSGWAHGAHVSGRKIVYCHTPARWLYQADRYVPRRSLAGASLSALRPALLRWDRAAARSADLYIANSRAIRAQISSVYGFDADVLPPPHGVDPNGEQEAIAGLDPGFLLCVARLLPYKNVVAVVDAMRELPDLRLVVVGEGPEARRLRAAAPANVAFVAAVTDAQLRWLYASSAGAVTAAYEDFGLVPLEAAAYGRPTAALRFGGFLDTIVDGQTGVLFDEPTPGSVVGAVRRLCSERWDRELLREHAARFGVAAFAEKLRRIVQEIS